MQINPFMILKYQKISQFMIKNSKILWNILILKMK